VPPALIWRLAARHRVVIIAIQALLPGTAVSFFWLPVTGDRLMPAPVAWLLLTAAWLTLAYRAWQESATLTADALVVRNVFRTRRAPLGDLTRLRFRNQGALVVWFAGPVVSGGPGHRGGRRVVVAAIKLGAAYWSGRRVAGDEAADTIAAAAGLPPLPLREEIVSLRQAWFRLSVAVALLAGSAVVWDVSPDSGGLVSSARHWLSRGLAAAAAPLLFPAVQVTLDGLLGRWRRQRNPPDC
jgi:uncharacterized protein YfiM (DUF2279 family)